MSLGRGFRYAGTPSIVASLWQVNEGSTTKLMQHFYQGLGEGIPQATALADAKRSYLAEASIDKRSPYFWAAFVHFGQGDPIAFTHSWKKWLWLVGILCGLLGLFWLYRKSVRNP